MTGDGSRCRAYQLSPVCGTSICRALLLRVFDHVGKDLRRIFGDAGIDVLRRVFGQHGGKAAAVILVRVRIDHIGQLRHVQPVQAGHQELPLLDRSAVDEHCLARRRRAGCCRPARRRGSGRSASRPTGICCAAADVPQAAADHRLPLLPRRAEIRHGRNGNNDQQRTATSGSAPADLFSSVSAMLRPPTSFFSILSPSRASACQRKKEPPRPEAEGEILFSGTNQTNSMTAISAASPRRGPMRVTRV